MNQDNSSRPSRRTFLQASSLSAIAATRAWGANDRINVAIVGVGGRGRNHITEYSKQSDARIYGLCDVDQANLERGVAMVKKLTGDTPKSYQNMKDVFADPHVDAVSMPLPNHWHALAAVWACQAGKDVYIEKPACHDPYEGRQMIAAARTYGRMVQVGSQGRSLAHKMRAVQLLKDGAIGNVYMARGLCFKRRKSIGHTPIEPIPPGVDWDKFLGPAPMIPFSKNRFLYNWHWFWDTGNGDIGNQGVHEMDIARWGLGVDLPRSVVANGGKYAYDDDQQTPNTLLARFDYGDKELVFEVRGLPTGVEGGMTAEAPNTIGVMFYGEKGWMALDANGYRIYGEDPENPTQQAKYEEPHKTDTGPHITNFLKGVRSRNYQDLHADVEIGVKSADLCHLANISYRLGGTLLNFDQTTQRFDHSAANDLAHPQYREPYIIPQLA
ncbi:MAG TPA: Gfo/Idh/MocA family oxidoreductase [Bryobacteraceae bacterium]|jgi:predicted dehydrogenase|nr:Gfo/Idh/MocA family oxidoreductase [Bryobacteraceae bacterium]